MDMVAEMKNDTRLMEWSGIEDQDTVISLNAFTPQTNQSRKPLSHRRHWHIRLVPNRRDGGVKKRGRVWPNQSR